MDYVIVECSLKGSCYNSKKKKIHFLKNSQPRGGGGGVWRG